MGKLPHLLAGKMLLGFAFAAQAQAALGQPAELGAPPPAPAQHRLGPPNPALQAARPPPQAAQDKVDIARDTTSLFEGSLRAAELRLKAGDIARADVARLRVDALRARNDARAAEADRRRAQLALAYLIGAEPQASDVRAADPWPSPAVLDAADVAVELVERGPDVRRAKNRVATAQNARELSR